VVSNTGSIPIFTNLIQLVGDRWTANLIALAYLDLKRFDEFHRSLPVATNILSDRLKLLVEEGIFIQIAYQQSPLRHEYQLTEKGLSLYPWFLALLQWGDKWCDDSGKGQPLRLEHIACGKPLKAMVCCNHCGDQLKAHEVSLELPES
jgi:DNA-binding HxlR family transcriptional regulator